MVFEKKEKETKYTSDPPELDINHVTLNHSIAYRRKVIDHSKSSLP